MTPSFKLKKGEIIFDQNKIVISDDASNTRRIKLISSSLWTFAGTISILRYLQTGDEFLLWTGLLIGLGNLLILINTMFQSVQSELSLEEVKSIKIKERFGTKSLDIRLKNNRLRRVLKVDDIELLEYVKANF